MGVGTGKDSGEISQQQTIPCVSGLKSVLTLRETDWYPVVEEAYGNKVRLNS